MSKTLVSPETLMADLGPIMKWLRSKRPDQVIARNVKCADRCLGAMFLRQSGYREAQVSISTGYEFAGDFSTMFHIGKDVSALIQLAYDHAEKNGKSSITAETALRLVRKVKRDRLWV